MKCTLFWSLILHRGLRASLLLVLAPVLLSTGACNQGQLSGTSQKKTSGSDGSGALSAGDNEGADEERIVDQPQIVSGAFLTCATVDTSRTKFPPDDSKETIGCSLVRDQKKVNLSKHRNQLEFKTRQGKQKIPSPSEEGAELGKWHRYGQISKDAVPGAEAQFRVYANDGSDKSQLFVFDLVAMKNAKSRPFEVPEKSQDPNKPGITFYPSKFMDLSKGASTFGEIIVPSSLCTNGVARSVAEIPAKYKPFEWANDFFQSDLQIYDAPKNPDGSSFLKGAFIKAYFQAIDEDLNHDGVRKCVISGEGCVFVVSRSPNYVLIFDKVAIDRQNITVEKLAAPLVKDGLCF